jgi:2,4-dienoyl-CoA reductase-like NADH-dependent reductase (Old Yellow Enzyme family)
VFNILKGGFMNIVEALHSEEAKLQRQLTAVKSAIAALNGGGRAAISPSHTSSPNGASAKRTMSAAVRAKIARSAKGTMGEDQG